MKSAFATLVVILFVSAMTAGAEHLADEIPAVGRPETRLAGIHLTEYTKLATVIRLYGKPTRVKAWKSDDPKISSQYECYWVRAGLNLRVVVNCPANDDPKNGVVGLISADAGTSRNIARTGRGLRIGQSLSDLRRLYGHRYKLSYIPRHNIHDVSLAWRQKEYTLIATLNRHNRITSLSLFAPE